MPNPPKFEPNRGTRGRGPVKLPSEGRKGVVPEWPVPGRTSAAERQAWAQLWSAPQAVAWERQGIGTVREVARYCRLLVQSERPGATAAVHAQATALSDRLGLTPKAMRLLLWEIVADETAQKRQEAAGARDRIKAV